MDTPGRVLLAVSGSIAAYKAAELLRRLQKKGYVVQVAMTDSAQRFITPLTFEALSRRPVLTNLWARSDEIQHVEQAYDCDAVVVAPATANLIAKLAYGLADDIVTATLLSTRAPMLLAPAMESNMWTHPATRSNIDTLRRRGVELVGPDSGDLASGRNGLGRLAEIDEILVALERTLARRRDLEGTRFLITAGPTYEPLDPVRVLTNRSTGAMGIAIAEAAAHRGADVQLVLGPTHLEPGEGVSVTRVETAAEMLAACETRFDACDVLVATAAVSDFRPSEAHAEKLKRSSPGAQRLELSENPDILRTMSERSGHPRPIIVGFAAETHEIERHALGKLEAKACDLVVANRVGPGVGFGEGSTEVLLVRREGASIPFGPASKREVAEFLLDQMRELRRQGSRS